MFYKDVPTLIRRIVIPGFWTTVYMLAFASVTCTICGFAIAIVLVLTDKQGLRPNRFIYETLSILINIVRSTPFVILIISIIPITRLVVGRSIGPNAAVFAITVAGSPLVARLMETSLKEVDPWLIEAAKSFGASDWQIVVHVLIHEAVPSIVSNLTLAVVSILGYTAMAGIVGAGGLGAVALTYGYQNFDDRVMYSTVLILIIFVQIIQHVGLAIYQKLK